MSQTPSDLPSHLSYGMFCRYESLIAQAVDAWPNATAYTPQGGVSLTTFTARFRDSVTSFRRYSWSPTIVNKEKFASIDGSFVIKQNIETNQAIFCKRSAAGRAPFGLSVPDEFVPKTNASPTGILRPLEVTETEAFCLLLSRRLINGPIIVSGEMHTGLMNQISVDFDIGYSYDPSSNTSTLI